MIKSIVPIVPAFEIDLVFDTCTIKFFAVMN
jgi:hypothetical protein